MTITAKYTSICSACGQGIAPGARIDWQRGSRPRHVACARTGAPRRPAKPCIQQRDGCCCQGETAVHHSPEVYYAGTRADGPQGPRQVRCMQCHAEGVTFPSTATARPFFRQWGDYWSEWDPTMPVGQQRGGYFFLRSEGHTGNGYIPLVDGRVLSLGYGSISQAYFTEDAARAELARLLTAHPEAAPFLALVRAPCVFSNNESHVIIEPPAPVGAGDAAPLSVALDDADLAPCPDCLQRGMCYCPPRCPVCQRRADHGCVNEAGAGLWTCVAHGDWEAPAPGVLRVDPAAPTATHQHRCPNCERVEVYPGAQCTTAQYRLCQHCPEQPDWQRRPCPWDVATAI